MHFVFPQFDMKTYCIGTPGWLRAIDVCSSLSQEAFAEVEAASTLETVTWAAPTTPDGDDYQKVCFSQRPDDAQMFIHETVIQDVIGDTANLFASDALDDEMSPDDALDSVLEPGGIFHYMTHRAKEEGMEHTLSPAFYAFGAAVGTPFFFGAYIKKGKVYDDIQQPEIFTEYTRLYSLAPVAM
jgi:hypothetical protein